MKTLLLSFCTLMCLTSCAPKEDADSIRLKNDIAQMLIVGFRGQTLADTSHIRRDISDLHVGGVILFEFDAPTRQRKRNIASPNQVKHLCRQLQQANNDTLPLLIGIDQEGGVVNRLRQSYGFPFFQSAKASAAAGPDSVRFYARRTAHTLHRLGINLNFAPCVDVDVNPDCPVIGKLARSFSPDPDQVSAAARIWLDEQQKSGVISCLKHFPGHGSADGDTHLGLVDVSSSWLPSELIPYRTLIAEGKVPMVMTAHVRNDRLDTLYPASLSSVVTTTLLRDSLHFSGVVITDDLAMGAIVSQYGFEEALRLAILAGADLLCLSNNGSDYNPDIAPQAIDIIFRLVKEGAIPEDRIHQSAARIRHLKQTLPKP